MPAPALLMFNKAWWHTSAERGRTSPDAFIRESSSKLRAASRARIVRFVDADHLSIEKDDGRRQTVTRDELRKIHLPSVDLRDSGLDPIQKAGEELRKVDMADAGP